MVTEAATPASTIDKASEAEQAARAELMDGADKLECATCGRDCKHIPATAGGGTAGGMKGEKWDMTPRSQARCPSCGSKPHRKEGRPHQMTMCLIAQVANHNGLTGLPRPSVEFARMTVAYLEAGLYKEPPSEKVMAAIIAGMPVEDALKLGIKEPKPAKQPKVKGALVVPAEVGEVNEAAAKDGPAAPIPFSEVKRPKAKAAKLTAEPPVEKPKKITKKEKKAEREAKLMARAEADKPAQPGVVETMDMTPMTREEFEGKTDAPIDPEDPTYDPLKNLGVPWTEDD